MTLDLTKPMRWKSDHTPVIVLWSDDNDTFAEWQPDDDAPVRQHMRTEWFSERVENISPEPVESDLVEQLMGAPTEGLWGWEAVRLGQLLGLAADEITRLNADLATRADATDRLATVIRELLERTSGNPIRRCHPVWVEAYAVLADYEAQKSTLTKTKGEQQP